MHRVGYVVGVDLAALAALALAILVAAAGSAPANPASGAGDDAGDALAAAPKKIEALLAEEGVAYDVANHRAAPPSFRIWGGATVELDDMHRLLPWLDWAYAEAKQAEAA